MENQQALFKTLFEKFPKVSLAFLPTPIHELEVLTSYFNGPKILIKRDDQTGLAIGGNKTRKLEYILGDALSKKVDTILTIGAIQSNSCRQAAAASAKLGLRCELLLFGDRPKTNGNFLLNQLFGAQIHWQKESPFHSLEDLEKNVQERGFKPYLIPFGGSNVLGVIGYIQAMIEMMDQIKRFNNPISHIFLAGCSGSTHVGLMIGAFLSNFSGKIISISVDTKLDRKKIYQTHLARLANETMDVLKLNTHFQAEDFIVDCHFANGYGVMGDLEKEAIYLMAQKEGILLDPVYTGRAFGALIQLIQKGFFAPNETVLFWHTGGAPGLFSYADDFFK